MTPTQIFIEALQKDSDWMYNDRFLLWTGEFASKWKISSVTVQKYMKVKKRTYPSKEEIKILRDEWKDDMEIRKLHNITQKQLKALSLKKPSDVLTKEQKKEIKESKDSPESLAKKYNVARSMIDQVRGFQIKISTERILNTGKWDRSEKEPYWKNIWEVHTMWPAKFIKFNTPLWIPEEKWL